MSKIAFFTFGILNQPPGHPDVQGFVDRAQPIFMAAMNHEGFRGFATGPHNTEPFDDMSEADYHEWGAFAVPRFYTGSTVPSEFQAGMTLTTWADLISVFHFSYTELHAEALKHRHEWTQNNDYPPYVMWWVDDDHTPTWAEACQKHEHFHDHGASAEAFNFKTAFDPAGNPIKVNVGMIHPE